MAKLKDGYLKQIGSAEGNDSYALLAGGGHLGYSNSSGANMLVQRDANGYILNSYFNTTSGGAERNTSGLGYIAGFNSGDYYIRSYGVAAVKSWLGLGSNAYDSTAYLPLTGGVLTGPLTIQSGNDGKIVLNNTDTETKYQQIVFQQNSTEYARLGTYGNDDLRWSNNIVWHAGNFTPGNYLPIAGGTMTGALNFKNGTWNNVGDDVAIGDINVAGQLGVKALNTTNPGIAFYNSSATAVGNLVSNAGTLQWSNNTVLHSGNVSSYLYEANLNWGGKNFNGTYGCIDAAMVPFLGANRLAFANPSGIAVEYSRDSGGTWTDYGASDGQKLNLTSGAAGSGLNIGNADSTNKDNGTYQLRITFNTGVCSIYTQLNKFCIYISSNGSSGITCTIEKALESTPDVYSIVSDMVPISGWSGYNIINTPTITTYGGTPSSQYGRLRFIFRSTGGSTTYNGLQVINIFGFGGVGWVTPSSMAKWGQIYSYDYLKNVTFPAAVTATSFNGTATAANKVNSTLTFTGYSTQTFNGSSNVSVAIPNNTNQLTNGAGYITSSGSISGNAATATRIAATVSGTNTIELVRATMADNDYFRILVGGTASNAGFAEIATADDANEPIYVRQYSGAFTSLTRTATLLDASGNTSFPGTVTASNFSGLASNSSHLAIVSGGASSTWNWSGQGGQPTLLWGSNDGTNMYVYNPSNFSVNYAASSGKTSYLQNVDNGVINIPGTGQLRYDYHVNSGTAGLFPISNNANSIISFNKHDGSYDSQLGFSSNGNIYYRNFNGTAIDTTTAWKVLLDSGNYSSYVLPLSGGTMTGAISSNSSISTSSYINVGSLRFRSNAIEDWTTASDTDVAFNYYGYNGAGTYYRNLVIYSGKTAQIAKFEASTANLTIGGNLISAGVYSSGDVNLNNERYLKAKDTSGSYYNLLGVDGGNYMKIGNATLTTIIGGSGALFNIGGIANLVTVYSGGMAVNTAFSANSVSSATGSFGTSISSGTGSFSSNVTAASFIKSGYNDTYALLAGGGHKALANICGDYVQSSTTYYAGSGRYLYSSGYLCMPNGIIFQWGYMQNGSGAYGFPYVFPTKCLSINITTNRTNTGSLGANHAGNVTTSSFYAVMDGTYGWMFAVGC